MTLDKLAVMRTDLANERTLLAFFRTSLAFWASGATLIHFVPSAWGLVIGTTLAAVGTIMLICGIRKFLAFRKKMAEMAPRQSGEMKG